MRKRSIVIIGKGVVGGELLRQLAARIDALRASGCDLRVLGIVDVEGVCWSERGFSAEELRKPPASVPHKGWEELTEKFSRLSGPLTIVDVTAAPNGTWHGDWLERGWSVVTANKKALSGPQALFDRIMAASKRHDGPRYLHETTVGAGLPVLHPLEDLLDAGDRVLEIRAAVSGTMGFICAECGRGRPFAEAVAAAKAAGFTEPDPRDDLSGTDVARKALILARMIGQKLELEKLAAVSLVPDALREVSREDFMRDLSKHADPIDARFREAKERGNAVRYLVTISPTTAATGLVEVPAGDPFAGLDGPENLFVIRTERYDKIPLSVRGPGAGAAVTASGVFAEILRSIE